MHARRFDDAYFLEPEAVERASKGDTPDVSNPGVSAAPGRPGDDNEDGGDVAKITAMAAAVPGLPLDGADSGPSCGGSGEENAREGEPCPQKQADGEGGRFREVETGGVVARALDATAVERETNSGDSVEVGIGGVEDPNKGLDCGVVCREQGVDERVGADSTPVDVDVAAEGARPPAAWTSSKRPRKNDANAAAVV